MRNARKSSRPLRARFPAESAYRQPGSSWLIDTSPWSVVQGRWSPWWSWSVSNSSPHPLGRWRHTPLTLPARHIERADEVHAAPVREHIVGNDRRCDAVGLMLPGLPSRGLSLKARQVSDQAHCAGFQPLDELGRARQRIASAPSAAVALGWPRRDADRVRRAVATQRVVEDREVSLSRRTSRLAISLAPVSMASSTAARAHASGVIGSLISRCTATTPCVFRLAATMPAASPWPLSDGSTPTTVRTGLRGIADNRQVSSQTRRMTLPSGDAGTP